MSRELARKLRRNPTGPEQALWRILWIFREQGWHFRRQVPIGRYYADFACLHAKLILEVDGDTHGLDDAIAYDAIRDTYMQSRGFQVLRFSNDDVVANPEGVHIHIAGVLEAISSTTNTPHPVPPPQGGRRRRSRHANSEPKPEVMSPSPLRGGDRGGGAP